MAPNPEPEESGVQVEDENQSTASQGVPRSQHSLQMLWKLQ